MNVYAQVHQRHRPTHNYDNRDENLDASGISAACLAGKPASEAFLNHRPVLISLHRPVLFSLKSENKANVL